MKIYRLIALICIYIAGLFLVSHAILPHCNHSEENICVAYGAHDNCEDKACSGHKADHSMNCSGESNGCILTKIIPNQNLSSIEIVPSILDSNVDLLFCICILELMNLEMPIEVLEDKYWEEQSYYTSYISPTLGLRAPPFI